MCSPNSSFCLLSKYFGDVCGRLMQTLLPMRLIMKGQVFNFLLEFQILRVCVLYMLLQTRILCKSWVSVGLEVDCISHQNSKQNSHQNFHKYFEWFLKRIIVLSLLARFVFEGIGCRGERRGCADFYESSSATSWQPTAPGCSKRLG